AVTIPETRRLSGLGNTTIWKLIGDGTLQTVRVRRRRLVLYPSLVQLLTPAATTSVPPPRRRGRPRKARTDGGEIPWPRPICPPRRPPRAARAAPGAAAAHCMADVA